MPSYDLITIGDSTIDTFLIIEDNSKSVKINKQENKLCLNYADKISINHSTQSVGGNAANVAVGAKKIGLKSAIVTELGDDINGHVILDELEKAKVDTKFVKILPNQTTRYSMVLNYKSERTILSSQAKRKYSLPKLPATKWIYYTSLGKSFPKLQKQLLKHLKKNPKIKLAHNPGSYQLNNGLDTIKKLMPLMHVLIVNKEEAMKFTGKKKSIKLCIKALHKFGPKIVVITDSIRGSYASDGKTTYFMKPYTIKAKARTGAGDAYTSGFLSALIWGKDVPEAMQWGTANAGGVIQEFGAQRGLLNQKQIQKNIKKFPKIKPTKI